MHIYLCTILTISFLEVSPARRATLPKGPRVKYASMVMLHSNNLVFGGGLWQKVGPVRRTAGKEGVQGAQSI